MEYLSTGEVAKKLNVSLRTLRYYDQIELVTPSHKEENGRRYYLKEDVFKLEKVLLLRAASLSLEDIQKVLHRITIKKTLSIHKEQLQTDITHLQQSLQFTNELCNTVQLEGEVQWKHLLPLFSTENQSTKGKQKKEWMEELFTDEERVALDQHLPTMNSDSPETTKWINLIKRIEICLEEEKHPDSKEGQLIALDTLMLSNDTFKGDHALAEKFWEARKSETASSGLNLYPVSQEILEFLEEALSHHEATM
ncbi:MerR family transcriptional regulator [Pontibacillus chungwhensis BH030062]|uniref:MerR family transcriptional regulator n=1 Tax=Pontibacillus chungwhensis BH030062 TaxID=1385513 RepID=A0A0A2V9F6_9BACI|nr:MerR family transcriptional regulator [Pontibacillus chungwhensis]KGP90325.1 MerR family transcriptional regulator [Pontibacillus chungwhensis BH030062]